MLLLEGIYYCYYYPSFNIFPLLLLVVVFSLLLLFNLILSSYMIGCLRGGKSAFYYVSLLSFGGSDYDNIYPP